MATATATKTGNPFAALGEALESAAGRFEKGSDHARQSAINAAGNTQRIFKTGLYNTAYGLSYGLVFATVYVTELLPKDGVLRRGLEDGADAALDAQARLKAADEATEGPEIKETSRTKAKAGATRRKAGKKSAVHPSAAETSADSEG